MLEQFDEVCEDMDSDRDNKSEDSDDDFEPFLLPIRKKMFNQTEKRMEEVCYSDHRLCMYVCGCNVHMRMHAHTHRDAHMIRFLF